MTPKEWEQLVEEVARQIKIAYLRTLPGMDEVAVALNARPNYDERERVRLVLLYIERAGYTVSKANG